MGVIAALPRFGLAELAYQATVIYFSVIGLLSSFGAIALRNLADACLALLPMPSLFGRPSYWQICFRRRECRLAEVALWILMIAVTFSPLLS